MNLLPWEYLKTPFTTYTFPDIFDLTWVTALVGLVAIIAIYLVRTRQLRRHPPYLDLYEWLLWTAAIFFFLLIVFALFRFYFIFIVVTIPIGVGLLIWIRFVRFPPILARYEQQLAKARFYTKHKYAHPEATIRPKRRRRR